MQTRLFGKILLFAIIVIALTGAAEAAIASSGGGLSSAMTGAGVSSAAGSLSAGHSASVAKTLTQTLVAAGTFSTSTSGTQSATDGFVTATVQGASLYITGFLDGPGTVTATALVQARGDEGPVPDPQLWVDTLVAAATEANVLPGTHGTATARATGTATARGTMAGVGTVSAISSGTATASSDARDLFANGAAGWAQGQIWSYSSIDLFGTVIGIDDAIPVTPPPIVLTPSLLLQLRPVPLMSGASTIGGATASATASGSSQGTATAPVTGNSGSVMVSGRTAASGTTTSDSTLTGITFLPPGMYFPSQGWIDGRFETGTADDDRYAQVTSYNEPAGAFNPAPGVLPDFTGTMTASASGSSAVNGRNPIAGATYRDTASGIVTDTATQTGFGITGAFSTILARDGLVTDSINLEIPRDPYAPPTVLGLSPAYGTSWQFDINNVGAPNANHDESLIASAIYGNEQGGQGTARTSANGNAATSTTMGALAPFLGVRTTTSANGQTSVSGTTSGGGVGTPIVLGGRGIIASQAATGVTTDYFDFTVPGPALGTFNTHAGAVSMVGGILETIGDSALPTDTFTGSVSANGQTSGSATDNGLAPVMFNAASRAGGNIQGSISTTAPLTLFGSTIGMGFGAESYGFGFSGTSSSGGPLFPGATASFAIAESAIEARSVWFNLIPTLAQQTAGGRLTGGSGHGDAGFAQPSVVSVNARSDTTGSTDVSLTARVTPGVSQTFAGTRQTAADLLTGNADVVTRAAMGTLARDSTGLFGLPATGSTSASLTGARTSGAGNFNLLAPPFPYSVSSDATLSGGMRSTENIASIVDGLSQTQAFVISQGIHDTGLAPPIPDEATITANYFAQSLGDDGFNERGTASITGLSLAGHSASQGDSARLTLAGGSATVNMNSLANTFSLIFPVRTASLGGTSGGVVPFGLGMNQGVQTGTTVTANPNDVYGQWAGIVDSRNSAPAVPFVPL